MKKLFSKVTPYLKDRLANRKDDDPFMRQYCISELEYDIKPFEDEDPIGDDVYSKCKGVVHRYPDRALFMPRNDCFVQCRFCFRKWKLPEGVTELSYEEIDTALDYFRNTTELWEVILTGGEPLSTNREKLKYILCELNKIEHIKIVRIHSRAVMVNPAMFDDDLIDILRICKPLYLVIHCNHPDEIDELVASKLSLLSDNGIVLLDQTALLKGINDSSEVLEQLFRRLAENRVKPYYLHHCDLVPGTSHFRTSIKEGQELLKGIRGRVSGICWPTYVLDIPKGFGKVPLGPIYYYKDECGNTIIEDYKGNMHSYPDSDNMVQE